MTVAAWFLLIVTIVTNLAWFVAYLDKTEMLSLVKTELRESRDRYWKCWHREQALRRDIGEERADRIVREVGL